MPQDKRIPGPLNLYDVEAMETDPISVMIKTHRLYNLHLSLGEAQNLIELLQQKIRAAHGIGSIVVTIQGKP